MKEKIYELNQALAESNYHFAVESIEVVKNGLKLEGVAISDSNYNAKAIFYPGEDFWNLSLPDQIDVILDIHANQMQNFDLANTFMDRDYILEHVYPKLVSDTKQDVLEEDDITFVKYLDMLVTFAILLPAIHDTKASFTIHHMHLEQADISLTDLYHRAIANVQKDFQINSIMRILQKMCPEMEDADMGHAMFVATNKDLYYGASVMLCPELLYQLGDLLGEPYLILPSSIHEIIAVPTCHAVDLNGVVAIVQEVNATLAPEEVLTNSVYICENGHVSVYKG